MAVRLEPRWTSNVQDLTAAGGDGLTLCWILAFEGFKTWPVTSAMQKLRECSGSRRFRAANDAREARELAQQMGEDNSGGQQGWEIYRKDLKYFSEMISDNKSQDSGIPPSCLRVIYGYSISRSTGHVWSSLWLQLYYSRRVGSVELAFKTCCLETKPHWAAILTIRDLCQKTRHSVYGKAYGAFALLHLQKDPGLQLIMSCWNHIPKKKSRVKQPWNKTSQEKRFFFKIEINKSRHIQRNFP